ncbi:hypothetical protein ABPG73_021215 [Tetrahymena malaccensis]
MGPLCQSCDVYGEIWGSKYSEIFSPGKCYRCSENLINMIIENLLFFLLIFLFVFTLLKNMLSKLQAKIAGYFINRSDILYLGSTLKTSEKSQILSKIFTDHLQILSLFSFFSVNLPNYFKVSLLLSGYNLYGQESFQQLFNIQSTQIPQSSIPPQQGLKSPQQTDRFILQDMNELNFKSNFKKIDSFKKMRDRWSYYSRVAKSNTLCKQISNDQDIIDSQEDRSPQSRYTNILESSRGQYTIASNEDQVQLTKEFNMLIDKNN